MNTLIDIALTSSLKHPISSSLYIQPLRDTVTHTHPHADTYFSSCSFALLSEWIRGKCASSSWFFSLWFNVKSICRPEDMSIAWGKHLAVVTTAAKRQRSHMSECVYVLRETKMHEQQWSAFLQYTSCLTPDFGVGLQSSSAQAAI